ncbi:MAG TPA: PVC-type heme-binding CxxCH protein, partial [Pirellulaceae bacterium]|nr:PVC-type heme-binding CxxCH protein [Pirellulaceae bacterium]
VMKARGIELTYTDKLDDLNAANLAKYDGLVVYANQERISPEQEKALLEYIESGKGFIPLHCASYCFLNSPRYIELVGAQFSRHGTGTFRARPTEDGEKHPLLAGYKSFESWDETYVHTKHNETDRTVLEYRDERGRQEPWTWVRTHGKGRVFYTAWGHDERTFGNPGFHNLVERGIRWAIGHEVPVAQAASDKPEMTKPAANAKPFEYVEADVPFYPAGERWGTTTKGKRKMQLPLPPEESMKHIVTPVGFQVELVVSEPQLAGKPIFMTWDERGRLWICETYDYPNELKPPGEGRDRIRICEDTDGDGKSDKFTVFAEKLSIPTAIAFYRGGAIVQDGRETIYLKDTDGDDKADLKKTLITGWNMRDTHGGVSNFHYGLDNWYWGMQGYNNSRPVLTDGKQVTGFGQGFFRFKVEGEGENTAVTELEFLRSTNNNTWGLGFSEEGIVFGSTANGNPSEYLPIPNRYYEAVRGWSSSRLEGIAESNRFEPVTENVRQVDHHGGFTAAAGHALYTARNYPREYWNRTAFVCEPTGHLVATFVITPDGAGFNSKNSWNLFASHDEWTAPIMAEVGPDGNVWVLDWYNYIVQHNPTPQGFRTGRGAAYESDLRDKKHGRVYRLAYTASGGRQPPDLRSPANAAPEQLVAALNSDNLFWRRHAQRLLVERGNKDVVPALTALVQGEQADELGLNVGAIHAMWTLHGLGAFKDGESQDVYQLALAGLYHDSPGVVRNAVQVAPHTELSLRALLQCQALSGDVNDGRCLLGLLALADWPQNELAAGAIAAVIEREDVVADRWLLDAATAAAAGQGELFLSKVASTHRQGYEDPKVQQRIAIVAEHVARGGSPKMGPILASLSSAQPAVSEAIVAGLVRGWPRDSQYKLSAADEETLVQAFEKSPAAARGQLLTLATKLGTDKLDKFAVEIAASFLSILDDEAKPEKDRLDAATQLVAFRRSDEATAATVMDLITPRSSPELAAGLLDALRQSESPAVAAGVIERMGKWTPAIKPAAMRLLLSRAEWTRALLDAAEKGTADFGVLSLDQKQALAAHPDRRIARQARELLSRGGGLPNADRQKVVEELMPLTRQKGDAAAGKIVFTKLCAKCHTHSGEGAKIGPDLTGMAVHPKAELLEQMIDPSKSVEGNFRVYSVLTVEGETLSGLLASETRTSIELIDAEAKRHTLLREDIEQLIASPKSLMPEGFEKQVSQEEITNLLEFLTQRGKYLPLPLDKVATVVSTKGMFYSEDAPAERLIFRDWAPKTFEGVPFVLVDPSGEQRPNVVLLFGPQGTIPPKMPRSVKLAVNGPAKAIHLLSGISGWGYPYSEKGSVTLIVRLTYEDGQTEDHELLNGEHFADYIRRVDVPASKFAYQLRSQQVRYLAVQPKRQLAVKELELVKGSDATAPVVMAVTVEGP